MLQMLGELEPTAPNARHKKRESLIDSVTGERIPRQRLKPEKRERVKSKKEIKRERDEARAKAFWDDI